MPPPQLACASQLVKQLYSVLICVDVNEYICCYVHYFAKVIWHYNSNSTHIWHFLPTGLGKRRRLTDAGKQTTSWCKGDRLICTNLVQINLSPLHQPLDNPGNVDVLETSASGSHLRQGDVKRKGADLLVAPLKLNVRLSKCGPRSVGRSAVRQDGGT